MDYQRNRKTLRLVPFIVLCFTRMSRARDDQYSIVCLTSFSNSLATPFYHFLTCASGSFPVRLDVFRTSQEVDCVHSVHELIVTEKQNSFTT